MLHREKKCLKNKGECLVDTNMMYLLRFFYLDRVNNRLRGELRFEENICFIWQMFYYTWEKDIDWIN